MRMLAALILVASLIAGIPAKAKDAIKSSQGVTVSSIQVVDVEDLQSDLSDQIEEHATDTPEELQALRDSINVTPQAVDALKKKGRTSAQVLAITVDANGVLTIFTMRSASK